jgi:hypothetical protein
MRAHVWADASFPIWRFWRERRVGRFEIDAIAETDRIVDMIQDSLDVPSEASVPEMATERKDSLSHRSRFVTP